MLDSVILHVGATKTGTSSIQSGLARVRDQLRSKGYLYPESKVDQKALEGRVTGGNVDALTSYLVRREEDEQKANTYINSYFDDLCAEPGIRHIIFSGERLGSISRSDAEAIAHILYRYAGTVTLRLYVRHITGHAFSQYNEFVKRRAYRASFETFAETRYLAPYGRTLSVWESAVPPSSINVLLYDQVRRTLMEDFLSGIGLGSAIKLPDAETVNRSLTSEEVLLMRHLNELDVNRTLLAQIAEDTLYNNKNADKQRRISRRAFNALEEKNGDTVRRLNETYLSETPLRIASEDVEIVAEESAIGTVSSDIALQFLEAALRVSTSRENNLNATIETKNEKIVALRKKFQTMRAKVAELRTESAASRPPAISVDDLLGMAGNLDRKGATDSAISLLAAYLRKASSPAVSLRLARLYLSAGQLEDARKTIEDVLQLKPDMAAATSLLREVLNAQRKMNGTTTIPHQGGNSARALESRHQRVTSVLRMVLRKSRAAITPKQS